MLRLSMTAAIESLCRTNLGVTIRESRVGHFGIDGVEQHLDPALRHAPRDENNAAAPIAGGPAIEPGRRMKDMLDAMDHRRLWAFENVHDALEPEDIVSAVLGERLEKQRQCHGPDRFLPKERIAVDAAVKVEFLAGMRVTRRLLRQPCIDIGGFRPRIIETRI